MFNFQFLIGSIVGFFIAFVLFVSLLLTDVNLDVGVATNIFIALATAVATAIHYSSIQKQRKDRIWEMNKTVLLDLSHSLSLVIQASYYYQQLEYAKHKVEDESTEMDRPNPNVFKDFKEKQEYAINVYKTLMDKKLISSIQKAKEVNENIDKAVNENVIDYIPAYDRSIRANKELQKKLEEFMAEMSGVNDI
ncbi:hypothetical protein [Pseudoalteromonas sp. SR43-2]|uniref:hypothetical protein n=1 Tax=Pseudoalteromonas sp. SR43-2 TaxID=2760944 RepID=UPI0015FE2ED3|nr:hypothetical protein [Pseudoalteromonas sp. SR43-2]MBB1378058.1 hypothetical protein [Pseudoalteromonas sp. SR43-2]